MSSQSILERFYDKVVLGENEDDCDVWIGAIGIGGYGRFNYKGKNRYAHRVHWLLRKGKIPKDKRVLHRCDNRRCVKLGHLFLGTQHDNMEDMVKKGRSYKPIGEKNPSAILNRKLVVKIFKEDPPAWKVAKKYGVSRSTVSHIWNKRIWKHVTGSMSRT